MSRNNDDFDPRIGCLIMLFFGCGFAGGLLYFIKCIIALFTGGKV